MVRWLNSVILLTFLVFCKVKCQGYNAVVVEYSPDLDDTADQTILRNVERYRRYIESAKDQGAAIIVFPEYGLTGFSDAVQDNPNVYSTAIPDIGEAPCNYDSTETNYSKALIDLSCSARANGVYVVANVIERALNSSNSTVYYNTNVVFDRKGDVLARYRKINLNNERGLTPGDEVVIFATDFTTFGIFTSDDILYQKPAQDVLLIENVTNIVFPTRWTAENPFLTPLAVQTGYAAANGLNLLAAGLSNVLNATTGSGFYFFNGTSVGSISSVSTSLALNAFVPELSIRAFPSVCNQIAPRSLIGGVIPDISQQNFTVEDLFNYTFTDVNLSSDFTAETVCSGSYCCNFNVSVEQQAETTEYYKLAAFYGVREYGYKKTIGVRVCALLACESASSSSCSYASRASTAFRSITITGNFADNSNVYDQPITLLSDYKSLDSSVYSYCAQKISDNSTVSVTLNTLGSVQGLRAFGIFGRVYSNDNLPAGPRSTAAMMTSFNVISLVILSYIVFLRE